MALDEIDAARAALHLGSITQPQIDRGKAAWALLVPDGPPLPTGVNVVTFITKDGATQGNWKGKYGVDGFIVVNDKTQLPAYATVTASGKGDYPWPVQSDSDVRALQRQSAGRIAACWYGDTINVDINLTDGLLHRVAFYLLDWDSTTRAMKIEALDGATVLHTQAVSGFNGGVYLVYDIKGRVTVRLTKTGGANAVVSGIFFG